MNLLEPAITMSYDPFKPPTPQTKPRPNEKLWEVGRDTSGLVAS